MFMYFISFSFFLNKKRKKVYVVVQLVVYWCFVVFLCFLSFYLFVCVFFVSSFFLYMYFV